MNLGDCFSSFSRFFYYYINILTLKLKLIIATKKRCSKDGSLSMHTAAPEIISLVSP